MNNELIVQKFGGSSLATPEQILSVAKRVSEIYRSGKKLILVTSAMGKTTDQLTQLAYQISPRPYRRELDMLLTTGERVSMALMAMALNDLGCPAISFTGSQAGIFTDGEFSNGYITELRPVRVEQALNENKIVVLAGFQGVDPSTKEITTLGRGGSDTTAVAMAAHFKASRCEVLKDVDGVFSSDPRIVHEARVYKKLPIETLYEFCFWGAKVLNYKSVEWAQKHRVPLYVGRSDDFSIGTEIVFDSAESLGFQSGQLLGVNSHQHVLEVAAFSETLSKTSAQTLRGASSETLRGAASSASMNPAAQMLLSEFKKLGLPSVQILKAAVEADEIKAHVTSDADIIQQLNDTFQRPTSPVRIVKNKISTITVSRANRPSEIHIVSSDVREKKIKELFLANALSY